MNKIKILIIFFFMFSIYLFGCVSVENNVNQQSHQTNKTDEKFIATWLTCYELKDMLKEGEEDVFIKNIDLLLEKCKSNDINAVFVQVRPFADSVYPSGLFPVSDYILSSDGKKPEFDVLKLLVSKAHSENIEIHAWVNPYRISYSTDINCLDENFISFIKNSKCKVVCLDEGIYFDPSSIENQALVLSGIKEILDNYDVDGIHIDDYFYPLTSEEFDKSKYDLYKKKGGILNFSDWRRENVNSLVSSINSLVHSYSENLVFSISPCGDINKNYSSYFADVEFWLENQGYADMIIPQLYYGFENEAMPFEKTSLKWMNLNKADNIKLVFGLAMYKVGKTDELSGKGKNEWIEKPNIIYQQIDFLVDCGYSDYALFSVSDLTN